MMRVSLLVAALLASSAAMPAKAASEVAPRSPLDQAYVVELQIGAGVQPTYPGSRFYRPVPVPGLSVRRTDEPSRFSAPDDGFGVPILDSAGFRAGPVGNVVVPRWRTHEELRGLHKVRPAIEIGGFAEYFPVEAFRIRLEVRQGVYGHDGLVATAGADYMRGIERFTFSVGPRFDFGSRDWAQTYFGVKPYEARRNGQVAPYSASGGLSAAGFLSTMRIELAPDWSVTTYGGVKRLAGSVAASPIPAVLGSRAQVSAGVLLARSFIVGPF